MLRQPGSHFTKDGKAFLPLYEGKLVAQFDHRHATFDGATQSDLSAGNLPQLREADKQNPWLSPLPRYWVAESAVERVLASRSGNGWLLGFREVTRPIEPRTAIFSIVPRTAVGHKLPLVFTAANEAQATARIVAMANSFVFDYCTRQKQSGAALSYFIVKQLPIIPPDTYTPDQIAFISARVLELTYTAWDIQAFAEDMGYAGPPFVWDEERRAQLRAQLDALYFHLYGLTREDAEYILSTFPIVRRKDEARHGTYRTRDLILSYYDAYAKGDLEAWFGREEERAARVHEGR